MKNNDIVVDGSISVGRGVLGYSNLISVGKNYEGHYIHVGGQLPIDIKKVPVGGWAYMPYGTSLAIGIVNNANSADDYTGDFIDYSGNLGLGVGYCYWPQGSSAKYLMFSTNPGYQTRYDNYILFKDKKGYLLHFKLFGQDIINTRE